MYKKKLPNTRQNRHDDTLKGLSTPKTEYLCQLWSYKIKNIIKTEPQQRSYINRTQSQQHVDYWHNLKNWYFLEVKTECNQLI